MAARLHTGMCLLANYQAVCVLEASAMIYSANNGYRCCKNIGPQNCSEAGKQLSLVTYGVEVILWREGNTYFQ